MGTITFFREFRFNATEKNMLTSFPFTGNYPATGQTDCNGRRRKSEPPRGNSPNSRTRDKSRAFQFKETLQGEGRVSAHLIASNRLTRNE